MPSTMQNISLTNPYATQQMDIERRRRLYEALQKQSMEPIEQQQTPAGGFAVPIRPTQGLAKIAQALAAAYGQKRSGEESKALGERRNQAVTDALGNMPQPRQETTYSPFDMASVGQGMMDEAPISGLTNEQTRTVQPTMQDNASWLGKLAQIDPSATAIGSSMLGMQQKQNESREAREARIAAASAQEIQANRLQANLIADRQAGRDQSESMRRDLASDANVRAREMQQSQLNMQRSIEAGRREDRVASEARRSEDRASTLAERITQREQRRQDKLDAVSGKQDEGKARVSVNLKALGEYYDDLERLGAMVDSSKSGAANVSARIRASGVGQFTAGTLGTEEQVYRGNINQMRPLLLQEIRQASAMGARGLDSNKELEFYLQAATDPARDIKSNRAAMSVLEKAYGLGSKIPKASDEDIDAMKREWAKARGASPGAAGGSTGNWTDVR